MASFDGRQRRERLTSRRFFLKARVVAARDQSASLDGRTSSPRMPWRSLRRTRRVPVEARGSR
jgi:hypothetical protein